MNTIFTPPETSQNIQNPDGDSLQSLNLQSLNLQSLKGQLLIAMPSMADSVFEGSVVYICDHSDKGALGIIVNRPTNMNVGSLLDKVGLEIITDGGLPKSHAQQKPVLYGGPVQEDRGFVLHSPIGGWHYSITTQDGVALTTSKDILEATATGTGPEKIMVTMGYAGWDKGQLEQEIADNCWLTVEADPTVLFNIEPTARFNAALSLLGIRPEQLSGAVGHD
jgi:putative transcriptional regulator